MTLAGKRIVNTRAAHQAAAFDALLLARGAIPLAYPCIAILSLEDTSALDRALIERDFDLLVLTSANTVIMLARRLQALGASLNGIRAAAIGEATAEAAHESLGVEISLLPDDYTTDALADALHIAPGMGIFLPQSEIARPRLAESLGSRGAKVTAITAYRTVRGWGGIDLAPRLRDHQVDAVTFTSSSTARFFLERLENEGAEIDDVCIASIGPETSHTARECGFRVTVEAERHTLQALVERLSTYFQEPN